MVLSVKTIVAKCNTHIVQQNDSAIVKISRKRFAYKLGMIEYLCGVFAYGYVEFIHRRQLFVTDVRFTSRSSLVSNCMH